MKYILTGDMPKHCCACKLRQINSYDWTVRTECNLLKTNVDSYYKERHPQCPLQDASLDTVEHILKDMGVVK